MTHKKLFQRQYLCANLFLEITVTETLLTSKEQSFKDSLRIWVPFWQPKVMPSKIDEKRFLFWNESSFVCEIFMVLSWLFWSAKKELGKKAKVNFKIYDVMNWEASNYNTHIAQYLKQYRQSHLMKFGRFMKYKVTNVFLKKSYTLADYHYFLRYRVICVL